MSEPHPASITQHVVVHTDGACSGNPGPGGWGAILQWGDHKKELKGGEAHTTNNRMELMAAIVALESLKRPCVKLCAFLPFSPFPPFLGLDVQV
jgi:ribonuclease HI